MRKNNLRPEWLTVRLPSNGAAANVRTCLGDLNLNTVCSRAHCPNQGECYQRGRATFLLMGNFCTRQCRYCAVEKMPLTPPTPLDNAEPQRVAQAVQRLQLRHVVITSVTRDDLPDGGAAHFAATVQAVRDLNPQVTLEILVPDFGGNETAWRVSADCAPEVYNHNLETVARLFATVRPQADFSRSVAQLKFVKQNYPQLKTKSGLMVGMGETYNEIIETAKILRAADVEMITLGQYLPPTPRHYPVQVYVTPETFARWRRDLSALGFTAVAAAPLVRSSYHAEEQFAAHRP